jgi:hypothetical protein
VKTIQTYTAQPVGDSVPTPVAIVIDGQLPDLDGPAARLEFQEQGGRLAHALREALLGGTWDAMLAEMLQISASLLRVGYREVSADEGVTFADRYRHANDAVRRAQESLAEVDRDFREWRKAHPNEPAC